ncbi:metallophosphoesterase family protein [Bdellovibrio sp. HCB337]|uniref:metallophosphoesterase family protein n=1 Tax=Bdellovibrio sp. HCB337 TaxID=3394358 RepID=UPI0039A57274
MRKLLLSLVFLYLACAPFRGSPYSEVLITGERDLNTKKLPDLNAIETDAVVRIGVVTDSHQNYRDFRTVVEQLNGMSGIDFVVHLGDFTNSAYNFEYDQFIELWNRLLLPKFCVQGNHDAIGAGSTLYEKAFGDANTYFESGNYRFISFMTNNWEDPNDFSPQWLLDRVQETTKAVIIFSHVPLMDTERYSGNDRAILDQVLQQPNVILSLNGHNHTYIANKVGNVVIIQGARVEGENWLTVDITATTISVLNSKGEASSWPR